MNVLTSIEIQVCVCTRVTVVNEQLHLEGDSGLGTSEAYETLTARH